MSHKMLRSFIVKVSVLGYFPLYIYIYIYIYIYYNTSYLYQIYELPTYMYYIE